MDWPQRSDRTTDGLATTIGSDRRWTGHSYRIGPPMGGHDAAVVQNRFACWWTEIPSFVIS